MIARNHIQPIFNFSLLSREKTSNRKFFSAEQGKNDDCEKSVKIGFSLLSREKTYNLLKTVNKNSIRLINKCLTFRHDFRHAAVRHSNEFIVTVDLKLLCTLFNVQKHDRLNTKNLRKPTQKGRYGIIKPPLGGFITTTLEGSLLSDLAVLRNNG